MKNNYTEQDEFEDESHEDDSPISLGDDDSDYIPSKILTDRIYNAFVNAGFKRDALKLSETVRVRDGLKRRTGLGHYIAFLDNVRTPMSDKNPNYTLYLDSFTKIREFFYRNKSKMSINLEDDESVRDFLPKFIKEYSPN